jgi:glucose-6-phosphate-specific signal transduction histidine kinase
MTLSPHQKPSPRGLWIALLWIGVGLFDATQTVVVMHSEGMIHNWPQLFVTTFLSWLPWALAAPFVLRLSRRYSLWRGDSVIQTLFVHIPACLAVGVVYSAWNAALRAILNPFADAVPKSFMHLWGSLFYNSLLVFAILYGMILLVGTMLESRERLAFQQAETARLNEQLSQAKLDALRRQIEPHFLFNTLNAVTGLVREGRNEAAVGVISRLSDLIRRVLEDSSTQLVTLGEEMEFVGKYLDIQKVRFGDRLQVRVDVPHALYTARVPSLILQPMVENAIKHGIARQARAGTVRIEGSRHGGVLTLRVYNDGPQLTTDWQEQSSGIGIPNVRTRLQSLYGSASEVTIRNCDDGVEAVLSVPLRELV